MKVNKKPLSRSEKRQAKRTVRKTARGQMKKLRKDKRGVKKAIRDRDVLDKFNMSKKEAKKNTKELFKKKKRTT